MEFVREIFSEFRSVVAKRSKILDSILPPLVFLLTQHFVKLELAAGLAFVLAISLTGLRILRGQSWGFALTGVGAVALAALSVIVSGAAQSYFLPGILSGSLTTLGCVVSILLGRPLVAFSSHLARGWPLGWYWHPKIRPAYRDVTWLWAGFFAGRALVQYSLLLNPGSFWAVANILLGWPTLMVLLVISYVYGTWRLTRLEGPSVEEFELASPPPWNSQQRGF
jgi:hypothetical protein